MWTMNYANHVLSCCALMLTMGIYHHLHALRPKNTSASFHLHRWNDHPFPPSTFSVLSISPKSAEARMISDDEERWWFWYVTFILLYFWWSHTCHQNSPSFALPLYLTIECEQRRYLQMLNHVMWCASCSRQIAPKHPLYWIKFILKLSNIVSFPF